MKNFTIKSDYVYIKASASNIKILEIPGGLKNALMYNKEFDPQFIGLSTL